MLVDGIENLNGLNDMSFFHESGFGLKGFDDTATPPSSTLSDLCLRVFDVTRVHFGFGCLSTALLVSFAPDPESDAE